MTTTPIMEWECELVNDDNEFLNVVIGLWLRRWQWVSDRYGSDSDYYIVEHRDEPDMFYIRYSAVQTDQDTVTYEKHECIAGPFDTIEAAQTAVEMLTSMEVEYD